VDLTGKVAFIAGKLGFSICVKVGFLSFISYTSYSYIPFSNSSGHFFFQRWIYLRAGITPFTAGSAWCESCADWNLGSTVYVFLKIRVPMSSQLSQDSVWWPSNFQRSSGPVWICHQVLLTLVDTVGRLHGHLGLAKNFWVQACQFATADSLSESRNWPTPVRPLLWELGHLCWRCFFGRKALQNCPLKTIENSWCLCNLCLQNRWPNEFRGSTWLWRKRRRTRRGFVKRVKVNKVIKVDVILLDSTKEQTFNVMHKLAQSTLSNFLFLHHSFVNSSFF